MNLIRLGKETEQKDQEPGLLGCIVGLEKRLFLCLNKSNPGGAGVCSRRNAQARGVGGAWPCCLHAAHTSQWARSGDFWRQLWHEVVAMGAPHMMLNDKTEAPKIPLVFFSDFTTQQRTRSVQGEGELLRGNWGH